ncbi:uncharacterized protein [Clytia hemisphaerica]|uniref:Potassium channel domain-containing protein n=1 Tax=Clytia hemisphaerica TaxID=252671 RepID=A0A7M5XAF5_9CNID
MALKSQFISNRFSLVVFFLLVNKQCQTLGSRYYNNGVTTDYDNNDGDETFVEEPNQFSPSASLLDSNTWYQLMYQSLKIDRGSKFLGCRLQNRYIKYFNNSVDQEQYCGYIPACKKPIIVRYTETKPLIYSEMKGTEKIMKGLLIDILEEVLVQRCCLGCTNLQFVHYTIPDDMFFENFNAWENDSIIAPVEFRGEESSLLGHHLVPLFQHRKVYFLGLHTEIDSYVLLRGVINNALLTWPLFVTALSMAVLAGVIIWISEQWSNEEHFQKEFPRGAFEGFWWAYVSMTTVGYGDKTPSTVFGRLFAILWILIGITLFNMFTAAIITGLNAAIRQHSTFELSGSKVGFIESKPHVYNSIMKEFAFPKVYFNTTQLMEALDNDEVQAIALDEYAYFHALPAFKNHGKIEIKHIAKLFDYHVGFGVMVKTNPYFQMQKEFNEFSQEDLAFSQRLVQSRSSKQSTEEASTISIIFDAQKQPFWLTMVCTCVGSMCMVLLWFLFRKCCELKNKSKVEASETREVEKSPGIKIEVGEKIHVR